MRWEEMETERKFAPPRARADELIAAAGQRLRRRVYDEMRPIAYARTTYLDTEELAYLRSAGGPVRQRLRVREYAGATEPGERAAIIGDCFLELKVTAGSRRVKARLAASAAEIERELRQMEVAPTLSVWYRRLSLTDEAERVRVTLDSEIEFSRPGARAGEVHHGPPCILEVKHLGELPPWLEELLAPLGEPVRISKYDLGMALLQSDSDAASSATRASCSRVSTEPGRNLRISAIAAPADIPSETK